MAWNPFANFGLLGGQDEETGAEIDPRYGVPRADVRQAQAGLLGNLGATLLAAGQRISPAQRAQLLGQLGPQMGQFSTDIYNAAQRRYQQGMLEEAKAKRAAEETQRILEEKQKAQLLENQAAFGAMLQPTYVSETEGGEMREVPSAYGQEQILAQFMKAYPKESATVLAGMLKPAEPTKPTAEPANIREYQYYRAQEISAGREPKSYEDFIKIGKQQTDQASIIRMQADKSRLDKLQESLDIADKLRLPLSEAQRMIESGKLTTGLWGEVNRLGGSILPALGIGSEEQYFRSLATQIAPMFKLPGAVTEYEMNLYMQAAPNLGDTKEANLLKINLINKMISHAEKKAEFLRNNLGSPTLYEDMRKEFAADIFTEDEKKRLQEAAGGKPSSQQGGTGNWSVIR